MTDAETILWAHLKGRKLGGWLFRRQHPVGPYIADFACVRARLVVEVDGPGHFEPEGLLADQRRTEYLRSLGWRVLRVTNFDVYDHLHGVIDAILSQLNHAAPVRINLTESQETTFSSTTQWGRWHSPQANDGGGNSEDKLT